MPRAHTHYDNLKVSRDAPIEVIRAAYKTLAAKYHPDLNPGNEKAARIMRVINRSYEVLSDPNQRAQHDTWIASAENGPVRQEPQRPVYQEPLSWEPSFQTIGGKEHPIGGMIARLAIALLIVFGVISAIYIAGLPARPNSTTPVAPALPPPVHTYTRPALAPNGQPWPAVSGYLFGNPPVRGNSSVTVDNTQNNSDMLAKFFDHQLAPPVAIRIFFVRSGEQFTLESLGPGDYDIRFQDLDSGVISREPKAPAAFNLLRGEQDTLTLFKTFNGTIESEVIEQKDF